jgi:hypothetical protein
LAPGLPVNTKIYTCSSPLDKMVYYFHIIYAAPPVLFKSPPDYLENIIRYQWYEEVAGLSCLGNNDKRRVCTCLVLVETQFYF